MWSWRFVEWADVVGELLEEISEILNLFPGSCQAGSLQSGAR